MGRKTSGRLTDPAPLVTATEDLARRVGQRVAAWPAPAILALGTPLLGAAIDLAACCLSAVRLPLGRRSALTAADAAAARVLVGFRVAQATRLLPLDEAQQLGEELARVGRMIGGWLKSLDEP